MLHNRKTLFHNISISSLRKLSWIIKNNKFHIFYNQFLVFNEFIYWKQ